MNSNNIHYDVIYSDELYDLIIQVNSKIKENSGWEPLGGISFVIDSGYSFYYNQAMIQKVEE